MAHLVRCPLFQCPTNALFALFALSIEVSAVTDKQKVQEQSRLDFFRENGLSDLLTHLPPAQVGFFPCFFKFFTDNRLEIFQGSGLRDTSVYKYGGSAPYADAAAQLDILVDSQAGCRVIHIFFEFFHVQVQLTGHLQEFSIVQVLVVLEYQVVVLPEFSLPLGRRSRKGSLSRKCMVGQGVILEDQFHIFRVLLEQLLEERIDPRTGRSLKIAEHGDDHRCRRRALEGRHLQVRILNGGGGNLRTTRNAAGSI
jgi:hypothetical protein